MSEPSESDLRQWTVTAQDALDRAANALADAEEPIDELVQAGELDEDAWRALLEAGEAVSDPRARVQRLPYQPAPEVEHRLAGGASDE